MTDKVPEWRRERDEADRLKREAKDRLEIDRKLAEPIKNQPKPLKESEKSSKKTEKSVQPMETKSKTVEMFSGNLVTKRKPENERESLQVNREMSVVGVSAVSAVSAKNPAVGTGFSTPTTIGSSWLKSMTGNEPKVSVVNKEDEAKPSVKTGEGKFGGGVDDFESGKTKTESMKDNGTLGKVDLTKGNRTSAFSAKSDSTKGNDGKSAKIWSTAASSSASSGKADLTKGVGTSVVSASSGQVDLAKGDVGSAKSVSATSSAKSTKGGWMTSKDAKGDAASSSLPDVENVTVVQSKSGVSTTSSPTNTSTSFSKSAKSTALAPVSSVLPASVPPPPPSSPSSSPVSKPKPSMAIVDPAQPAPPSSPPPKRTKSERVELRALFDYDGTNDDELSFKRGSKLWGFELMESSNWWYAELATSKAKVKPRGMVPANFVEAVDPKIRRELAALTAVPRSATTAGAGTAAAPNSTSRPAAAGGASAAPRGPPPPDASKLKLTFFAHNLAYGTVALCFITALASSLWWTERSQGENSRLKVTTLVVYVEIWVYALFAAPCIFYFEYNYGLIRVKPKNRTVSLRGITYALACIPLWFGYPTMLAGALLLTTGAVNALADYNQEEGDGSQVQGSYFVIWFDKSNNDKKDKKVKTADEEEYTWWEKAKERGTLSQNLIVISWFAINGVVMAVYYSRWSLVVQNALRVCVDNSEGATSCPSTWAPAAKMFGGILNLNCAFILFPVLKSGLRWANNFELRSGKSLTAYLPLRKNIIFHRLLASFIAFGTLGHVGAHFVNFALAPEFALFYFGESAWWTGSIVLYSMFIIYAGAQNRVKRAHYEIFWNSHHMFILFFFAMIAHGPDFWAFAFIPVVCYVADRVYRLRVGNQPFYLRRVLYNPPVMEVSFFPAKDFVFREGQYLYLLAPHISPAEWHPFTISSAHGDLESSERKEVTVHIRVQGDKSWTRRLMEYFALMTHSSKKKGDSFLLELAHYNSNGELEPGKYLGPDGVPLLSVDGPHAAPAQQYNTFKEVMLVGAGIGLTPSSAILKAILRHKWKKGFNPSIIYFYWVVRHDEIESFRWFVNVLVELEKRVASDRHAGAVSPDHYLELNVYITGAPKPGSATIQPKKLDLGFSSAHEQNVGYDVDIGYNEESLMRALLNPKAMSDKQREIQGGSVPLPQGARMFDIWIWNGRPNWSAIFRCVKEQRNIDTEAIGCCFCGTPVIGKDLKRHCQSSSSLAEKIRFDLHKENF